MQFKRSPESPVKGPLTGGSGSPRYRGPLWLTEWIKNSGYYVMLECRHWESFAEADTSQCLIRTFTGIEVHCKKCDRFRKVHSPISLCEYMNIPKPVKSSEPPF